MALVAVAVVVVVVAVAAAMLTCDALNPPPWWLGGTVDICMYPQMGVDEGVVVIASRGPGGDHGGVSFRGGV